MSPERWRTDARRCCALALAVQHGEGDYVGHVREMLARKQTRLLVDVNDLRAFDADLTKRCAHSGWAGNPTQGERVPVLPLTPRLAGCFARRRSSWCRLRRP